MSFPRYPKYKASGVEWLGDVPEGWRLLKLGLIARSKGGAGFPDEHQGQTENEIPFFKVGDMVNADGSRVMRQANHTVSAATAKALRAFVFPAQTIVFAKVGAALLLKRYRLLGQPSCIDNNMMGMSLGSDVEVDFLLYVLPLLDLTLIVNPGAVPSINEGQISSQRIILPPPDEQTAIAEFLDRETGKIDELVAEQRRLMELLKEKRQAVISHAVTKGLNPHAPMKPSGIEWLGDVPEGWEVRKVSQLFRAGKGKNGQMLTKEFCGANQGDYPVYSGQTENEGVMGTWDQFEFDFGEGGVLFSTTVGAKAMHLRQLFGRFSLSQNCMIIWPTSTRCVTRFFYYHFQPLFQWQRSMIPDHMQPSFRMEDLYACAMALPSLKEQQAIVEHLDTELAKFDTLSAEAQRAIDLLQERRTALISAAVTGQIDVRTKVASDHGAE
ncbi:restriction endonuclease subunit S [soil metagenome]